VSLRTRLLLALAAVSFVALVVADLFTYTELKTFLYNQVDSSLESSHEAIEAALGGHGGQPTDSDGDHDGSQDAASDEAGGSDNGGAEQGPPTGQAFCQTTEYGLAPGTFVEVRTAKGKVVGGDDCPAIESGGAAYSPKLASTIAGFSPTGQYNEPTVYLTAQSTKSSGPIFRVRVSKLTEGSLSGDELVLAEPLGDTHNTLVRLLEIELAVTAAALVAAVLLGWWLVRLGLHPLRRVELTAETIAGGELEHRVPGADRRTEVGRVALALNYMLESIERAFAERDETEAQLRQSEERLRRFVADASHELRTPVAAVSAYAQLFERVRGLPEGELERIMGGIRSETSRMGHLVEDLLLLARLDEGKPLARDDVELVDLASSAIETARMVGPQWPVRLVASEAVEVVGDGDRLRQVIDNLLGNVRAHAPAGTPTTITVSRSGEAALIEVADEGPGITEAQAMRVFERFYRVDVSRARTSGGAGLGLAIVASIVEAHRGTVSARPREGGGAVFTVRLPAITPSDHEQDPSDAALDAVGDDAAIPRSERTQSGEASEPQHGASDGPSTNR
jgi:two-component system OmpR family sensor kinase